MDSNINDLNALDTPKFIRKNLLPLKTLAQNSQNPHGRPSTGIIGPHYPGRHVPSPYTNQIPRPSFARLKGPNDNQMPSFLYSHTR